MSGNVWEWTQDCYEEDVSQLPSNGSAWEPSTCTSGLRVLRGGSWFSEQDILRFGEPSRELPGLPLRRHRFPSCPGLTLSPLHFYPLHFCFYSLRPLGRPRFFLQSESVSRFKSLRHTGCRFNDNENPLLACISPL